MPNPKSIGIKLYNDSFVPVLTDDENEIKKITLTTVRDDQKMAIIELYEGTSDKCINNEYLGKITIDIERETQKGSPVFEAHLRKDSNGMLYAKAWDIETGRESEIRIEHSQDTQRIFTETLSDEDTHTHSLDADENIASFSDEEEFLERDSDFKPSGPPIGRILLLLFIALLLVALLAGSVWGIYTLVTSGAEKREQQRIEKQLEEEKEAKRLADEQKQKEKEDAERERKEKEDEEARLKKEQEEADKNKEEEAARLQKEEDEKQARLLAEEQKKKEEEQKKISGLRKGDGEPHFVRWGDNLWNICKRYYNDPWYYPALAEYNGLTNPRKIFAGQKIIIPDKSELRRWDFSR